MKQSLKRIAPEPIWRAGSNFYWWWINRGRHTVAQKINRRWSTSRDKIQSFQNKHEGERCFIIGNGPSLRQTDLNLLKNEITFGLNRIYLLFPELGFTTTYLVSVNDLVLQQCAKDMQNLEMSKFVTWRARKWFQNDLNCIFLDTDFTGVENFSLDASKRIFEGFTVTYVGLQLAYYMGFKEVILIGVDHNFVTKGQPNQAVVSQGDDPNHFSGAYFGKGFRWQLPDLVGSERAYRMAKDAFSKNNRKILDATVAGKLKVFPKVDYQTLF